MAERFFCADPHFSHGGMIRFARRDGSPLRPEWGRVPEEGYTMPLQEEADRVAAMDEAMVERWNSVVGPTDKVELLGDVVINRRALPILNRLNGKKRLRMGNHDIFLKDYGPYFEEISAYKVMNDLICSHIPLHEESVKQRWLANVHGHLHDGRVMQEIDPYEYGLTGKETLVIHPRYLCVSMEHIDFTPISLDEVYARIRAQQEEN